MAHGTPDWGVTSGAVTTYQLTDLAELAVRLGSPVSFDRRGDVIWFDDFEAGLVDWDTGADGTGSAVGLSMIVARTGRYSALLTAGSDGVGYAQIFRGQAFPVLVPLGFEVAFHVPVAVSTFVQQYHVLDGSTRHRYEITYNDVSDTLSYLNAAGGLTQITSGLGFASFGNLFHDMKLVVDVLAGTYERLILDSITYDLASAPAFSGADAGDARIEITYTNNGRAGYNDALYLDAVILTQNEPV